MSLLKGLRWEIHVSNICFCHYNWRAFVYTPVRQIMEGIYYASLNFPITTMYIYMS